MAPLSRRDFGLTHLGARGVPFFVFDGRHTLSGGQPAAAFAQALETAWGAR